jgi:hypothetical protein
MAVLECPFCYKTLEVEPPDRLRTAFSTAKPIPNIYHGDIEVKKYKCPNPDCEKLIVVYWYAPLEYFNRI